MNNDNDDNDHINTIIVIIDSNKHTTTTTTTATTTTTNNNNDNNYNLTPMPSGREANARLCLPPSSDPLRGSSVKLGAVQRRLAWPLR